jgi:hypothetical protein
MELRIGELSDIPIEVDGAVIVIFNNLLAGLEV